MEERNEYKLYIRVTKEFYERFVGVAKKYGLTLNQLGSMSVQSGFKGVLRALDPEEAISPETFLKIIKAAEDQGVELNTAVVDELKGKAKANG